MSRIFGNMRFALVYNDIFDSVTASIQSIVGRLQLITVVVAILCAVIAGMMFLFGSDAMRTAKRWLVGIVIGCVIVFMAVTIGNTLYNTFYDGGF